MTKKKSIKFAAFFENHFNIFKIFSKIFSDPQVIVDSVTLT